MVIKRGLVRAIIGMLLFALGSVPAATLAA